MGNVVVCPIDIMVCLDAFCGVSTSRPRTLRGGRGRGCLGGLPAGEEGFVRLLGRYIANLKHAVELAWLGRAEGSERATRRKRCAGGRAPLFVHQNRSFNYESVVDCLDARCCVVQGRLRPWRFVMGKQARKAWTTGLLSPPLVLAPPLATNGSSKTEQSSILSVEY